MKWKRFSEYSKNGYVIATNHTCNHGRFLCTVTNYPGTKTLDWSISIPGTDWKNSRIEDRFEYSVKSLKEKVIQIATELENNCE